MSPLAPAGLTEVCSGCAGQAGAIIGDTDTAVRFDGSSWMNFSNPEKLRLRSSFTIEAWFKADPGWTGRGIIYGWGDETGATIGVANGKAFGNAFRCNNVGCNFTPTRVEVSSPGVYNDGAWHHVALIKDAANNSLTLLVDAGAVATITMTQEAIYEGSTSSQPQVVMGNDYGFGTVNNSYFRGVIDEVAVYDHVVPPGSHYTGSGRVVPVTPAEVRGGGNNPSVKNLACSQGSAADPVSTSTGHFSETFVDLAIPGRGLPLTFARTYSSDPAAAGVDGPLGFGWTHNYALSLAKDSSGAMTVRQENSSEVSFIPTASGYVALPRVGATLVKNGDGTFNFTRRGEGSFVFAAPAMGSPGRLNSITDLNGYTTAMTYTAGLLTSATAYVDLAKTVGRTLSFGYTGSRLSSINDNNEPATPRTVSFKYLDAANPAHLTEVVDVTGATTQFTYDASHRIVTMRLPNQYPATALNQSQVVTNSYNPTTGKVDWQTDQLNRKTEFFYNSPGPGSTRVVDPKGNQTVHTYTSGLLTSVTRGYNSPEAATWGFEYDRVTLGCTKITDPDTRTWQASYDSFGNRTGVIDPLLQKTTYTYNGANLVTSITDAKGNNASPPNSNYTTTLTYAAGCECNLKSRSQPWLDAAGVVKGTQTTTYNYAERGNTNAGEVTSVLDAEGHSWQFDYDTYGYLVRVTDPLQRRATAVFDKIGRKQSETSPKGNLGATPDPAFTTSFTYDKDSLLRRVTDPLGHTSENRYDANRNLEFSIDAGNHQTRYEYDPANQATVTHRADTTTSVNEYWPDGTLKMRKDGAGQATSYAYDHQARLVTVTDSNSRITTYGYHPAGNVKTKQDHGGNCASSPKASCTTYSYDNAGQLKSIDYADPATPDVTAIGYDPNGRRTSMTDGTGTSTWAWDSLGRMTESKQGSGATVGYGYDLVGNGTSISYPGTGTLTRHFDAAGRMDWVQDWLGNRTTFGYDENSNLTTQALPGAAGVTDTFGFDRADRLGSIGVAKLTGPMASFSYTRTDNGLVSGVDSSGVPADDRSFAYNELNQLCWSAAGATGSCEAPPSAARPYDYDPADNLAQQASTHYGHDAANQLCWAGSAPGTCASPPAEATSFAHDTRGNRTAAAHPHAPVTHTYDGANRMSATTTLSSDGVAFGTNGDKPVAADYDGDGDDEVAVFRASAGVWYVRDANPSAVAFGTADDVAVPADYDGDGDDDIAVFRPSQGVWYVRGGQTVAYGTDGDIPVPADYDGDGDDDIAVFRPSNGVWFIRGATPATVFWGTAGDVPVPADYDGDGRADIAVWRPSNGAWFVINSSGGATTVGWGTQGDIPAPADYDGDAKADMAVWRFSNGYWYFINSREGQTQAQWGTAGDIPATGDFDGDLRADMAVFRPSVGVWLPRTARVGTTTYAYDGDGLRSSKTSSGITKSFVWDVSGGLPMLLSEQSGGTTTSYIYGPAGHPLARVDSSGVVYYHHDQLGSTRLLTNAAGNVVASYTYDDYGRLKASTGSVIQPFGFAGEYTDAETGFQYLRARYYDPGTEQFLTRDPLEPVTGTPYAYANNSPLNFTDPSGQAALLALPALVGAFEVGSAVVDAFSTASTLADRCASGLEKLISGGLFAASVALPGGGYSAAGRAAPQTAVRGGAGPVGVGQQGLNALGVTQNTSRIALPGGRYRVPDILNEASGVIGEVKNVQSLSYTAQLRDYASYAQTNQLQFDLYVRGSTRLSGPLQQAVDDGLINLWRRLPG